MQVRREYNNPVDPNAMSVLREGGEQIGGYQEICAELLDNLLRQDTQGK